MYIWSDSWPASNSKTWSFSNLFLLSSTLILIICLVIHCVQPWPHIPQSPGLHCLLVYRSIIGNNIFNIFNQGQETQVALWYTDSGFNVVRGCNWPYNSYHIVPKSLLDSKMSTRKRALGRPWTWVSKADNQQLSQLHHWDTGYNVVWVYNWPYSSHDIVYKMSFGS